MIKNLGNSSGGAGGTVTAVTGSNGVASSGGNTPNLTIDETFANNFTTAQTITTAPAANTSNDGLVLQDTTPASTGNQQFSPRLRLTGQGWKTTATAASQATDWIIENQPVQGAAAPSTTLAISRQINGGGFAAQITIPSTGNWTIGDSTNNLTGGYTFAQTGPAAFGGAATAQRFSPTTSTIPGTAGIYLPVALTLGFGVNGVKAGIVDASGISVSVAGTGLLVKEGSNAKQGTSTLVGGTVVVANTSVTANSRIFITAQSLGTVAVPSAYGVSVRTAGTSFTILASAPTDTSVVAWEIFEPAA